jgi:hypothetical protein
MREILDGRLELRAECRGHVPGVYRPTGRQLQLISFERRSAVVTLVEQACNFVRAGGQMTGNVSRNCRLRDSDLLAGTSAPYEQDEDDNQHCEVRAGGHGAIQARPALYAAAASSLRGKRWPLSSAVGLTVALRADDDGILRWLAEDP